MTPRPPEEDIGRAARRLVVDVLSSASLKLMLTAGVVTVLGHWFYRSTGEDPALLPLMLLLALYDAMIAALMVRDIAREFTR